MKETNDWKNEDFLVIGAGLPRTGTMSLMTALEIILPGKCHHMSKAIHHEDEWHDILKEKMSDEEFKTFFLSNNYVSAVGSPFCFMYERSLEVFPNAKVILTVRDPETWVNSVQSTIFKVFSFPTMVFVILGLFPDYLSRPDAEMKKWPKKLMTALYEDNKRSGEMNKAINDGKGVEYFNQWRQQVEAAVSKEKLLTFNVKDGWEPLCTFLDVPHPHIPFPRANTAEIFKDYLHRNNRRAWLLLYEFTSIPILLYGLYKLRE